MFGPLGDRFGYRRVFAPCLVLITAGLVLLAMATTRSGLILSAIVFGTGFGTAYPVFAAYVTHGVREDRRGAAFGAILAAFDTGIGTGSSSLGWLVATFGYGTAFGIAAGCRRSRCRRSFRRSAGGTASRHQQVAAGVTAGAPGADHWDL